MIMVMAIDRAVEVATRLGEGTVLGVRVRVRVIRVRVRVRLGIF